MTHDLSFKFFLLMLIAVIAQIGWFGYRQLRRDFGPIPTPNTLSMQFRPNNLPDLVRPVTGWEAIGPIEATEGDYGQFASDANGRLWINVETYNCLGGCSGGTQFTEDGASPSARARTMTLQ